jgi:lipopolysaccharide export system protein LptC
MNTKDQMLDLHKDIYVQTSTGNEAWMSQATVDMAKGDMASDEHVDVKFNGGTVSSDRLRITGGGEVVRFEGNVLMHLDNVQDPSTTAAAAAPEPAPAPVSERPAKTRHAPKKTANSK